MVSELLQMSFVPLVAIILTLILLLKNKTISKRITSFYILIVIIFAFLVIFDMLDYYLSSLDELNNFRYVTSILGYSLRPIALLLVLFTLLRHNSSKKIKGILAIPAIVNILISLCNPFTFWMFRFDSGNHFIRGPLGIVPFVVSAIYLVVLLWVMISNSKGIEKTEIFLVIAMIISVVAAVVLESVAESRCLLNGVGVICTNCYFLYLNTQTYRKDDLTNLLNRRSFYRDIQSLSGSVYVVCIDMNDLKQVNDTYGHIAGDEALITIANVLEENVSNQGRVYRVGGDEFVVLFKDTEEQLAEKFLIINQILAQKNLSIAYGYAFFDGKEMFEKTYVRADEQMYLCKEEMKQKRNKE